MPSQPLKFVIVYGLFLSTVMRPVDVSAQTAKEALPFDLRRAHELYAQLLGPVAGVIKGKDLLIVPSGAVTQLPFQVLVIEPSLAPSDADALRDAAWLGASQSLTVLPTVSTIKTLRQNAEPSRAGEPFFGIGDPVLAGDCGKVLVPAFCPESTAAVQVAALDSAFCARHNARSAWSDRLLPQRPGRSRPTAAALSVARYRA